MRKGLYLAMFLGTFMVVSACVGLYDDCGGPGQSPCVMGGQPASPAIDTRVHIKNNTGRSYYVYYLINANTPKWCRDLLYDGIITNHGEKIYTVPAGSPAQSGWFRLQETTEDNGCPDSRNKFDGHSFAGGGDVYFNVQ